MIVEKAATASYRRRETNIVLTVVFLAGAAYFTFTANDSPSGVNEAEPRWVAVGVVGAVGCLALAVRAWRLCVLTTDDELTVGNLFRTRTFGSAEITALEMGERARIKTPVALLRPVHGRRILLSALEPPNVSTRPHNREGQDAVAGLALWHAQRMGRDFEL